MMYRTKSINLEYLREKITNACVDGNVTFDELINRYNLVLDHGNVNIER